MKNVFGALLLIGLIVLSACHRHRPAPIEEHSASKVVRQQTVEKDYRVRSGDTLSIIAFGHGLDFRDIARWNGISRPYTIYPGQYLRLAAPLPRDNPSGARSSDVKITTIRMPRENTTRAPESPANTAKIQTSEPVKTKSIPAEKTASPARTKTATATVTPKVDQADPKTWRWPANGRVLRTYIAGNPSRNGLDIVGTEGQPIMATAAGEVVYSGNGLLGYGELIIIKHSDRMLSAYAHNKTRLVTEGEQVTAGQRIAQMGRNPQNEQLLHFEIRVRGKPVDPARYLPAK